MSLSSTYQKTMFTLLLLLSPLLNVADTLFLPDTAAHETISLANFFTAVEDSLDLWRAEDLLQNSELFQPISTFKLTEPDHAFWLKVEVNTMGAHAQNEYCIRFDNLTFVDLYTLEKGHLLSHQKAGAFRQKDAIQNDDSRFHFQVTFLPKSTYTLLLRVKHTKKYPPDYQFTLQKRYDYLISNIHAERFNWWLQGAITVLLCYAGLSWLTNRYQPFLWVFLFLLGVGLYGFSLQPPFIDFFFPMHPEIGWLLVPCFLHLGIVGFYLLMIDFLEMKKNAPLLYRYGRYIVFGILIFSALAISHNYLTSNYYLTNQVNLGFSVIHLIYISMVMILLWRKLNSSQRFLIYGTIVFIVAAILIVGGAFLFREQSFFYAPFITKIAMLFITLLFLTGLNQQLSIHEKEKIKALEQFNALQKQYSSAVEHQVAARTAALKKANKVLNQQQAALIEQKNRIQTLMDELNHRVKNNLQMLYSLSSLQLPLLKDEKNWNLINEMRGRIKAMILVNEHLTQYSERQNAVPILWLVNEIKQHLQLLYDPEKNMQIEAYIPEDFELPANMSLPFGLILTELITNAFKHAFTSTHTQPLVKLILFPKEGQIQFIYQDNGQGSSQLSTHSSMGITLIRDLTRQLKGQVSIEHQAGFTYYFTFANIH